MNFCEKCGSIDMMEEANDSQYDEYVYDGIKNAIQLCGCLYIVILLRNSTITTMNGWKNERKPNSR